MSQSKKTPRLAEVNMSDVIARGHFYSGALAFHMEIFGNELAKREGYKAHEGFDAIRFYLMNKHSWLPRDVKSLSFEDLQFAMAEEMKEWVLPVEYRDNYPRDDQA